MAQVNRQGEFAMFIPQHATGALVGIAFLLSVGTSHAADFLSRVVTPEEVGLSSERLARLAM